jgi:LTXXQ motif family protein
MEGDMRKLLLAGAAVLVLTGSSVAVYAQFRPDFRMHMRRSPDDMSAFADARIAAVKAGLRLTPDQEKLWPPVEAAVKDLAKLRIDRISARRDRPPSEDLMTRLRERSDAMTANAAALKRVVDAADPLYKTLDDSQKGRLTLLTNMGGRFNEWRHRFDRWRHGGDFDGPGHRGMRGMDGMDGGPHHPPMDEPPSRL